jgi:hypothetical protein
MKETDDMRFFFNLIKWGFVVVLLGVFGLVALTVVAISQNPTKPIANKPVVVKASTQPKAFDPKAATVKLECQTHAKKTVLKYLKHSHTANFPFGTTAAVYGHYPDLAGMLAQPRWTISGVVDSQNDFGASVRTKWEVTYAVSEAKLQVMTVSINGAIVARHPSLPTLD